MSNGEAGKGDTQRPTDWDKFSENFEKIFGSKPTEKEMEAMRRQLEDAETLASYPAGLKKREGK
jgi:hypothetical protein